MARPIRLCQVALSVIDEQRTIQFYNELFGWQCNSESYFFRGPIIQRLQRVPSQESHITLMAGDQEFMQLELFHYDKPPARVSRFDRKPSDIGYTRITMLVPDFYQTLAALKNLDVNTLTAPLVIDGTERVCVLDPNGVYVEIVAAAPGTLPLDGAAHLIGVSLTVADLEKSRHLFGMTLDLKEIANALPDRERLWGVSDAVKESLLYDAGACWIEVSAYRQPHSAGWPEDYLLSDQGFLNIAFGFRKAKHFRQAKEKLLANGYRFNGKGLRVLGIYADYFTDKQGFSFELLCIPPWADGSAGYKKASWPLRKLNALYGKWLSHSKAGKNTPENPH